MPLQKYQYDESMVFREKGSGSCLEEQSIKLFYSKIRRHGNKKGRVEWSCLSVYFRRESTICDEVMRCVGAKIS
jgi:hypothetical protein